MKNNSGGRAATAVRVVIIQRSAGQPALATQRRCRNCGSDVPLGPRFCTNCGQPLSTHPR